MKRSASAPENPLTAGLARPILDHMSTITIALPDEQLVALKQIADGLGVSAEDLAREGVETVIRLRREQFRTAADHVLEKNGATVSAARPLIYLTVEEVRELHSAVLAQSGGRRAFATRTPWIPRSLSPRMTFGGVDLYPTLIDKATALGFSLIKNHAFVDGNKRIGHAAMETFLVMNGSQIVAPVDEQEATILKIAGGEIGRSEFASWLVSRVERRPPEAHGDEG